MDAWTSRQRVVRVRGGTSKWAWAVDGQSHAIEVTSSDVIVLGKVRTYLLRRLELMQAAEPGEFVGSLHAASVAGTGFTFTVANGRRVVALLEQLSDQLVAASWSR